MAGQTVERQKQLYSRELAAHTLRQWNTVHKSNDGAKRDEENTASSFGTLSDDDVPLRTDKKTHSPGGVHVIDFAAGNASRQKSARTRSGARSA